MLASALIGSACTSAPGTVAPVEEDVPDNDPVTRPADATGSALDGTRWENTLVRVLGLIDDDIARRTAIEAVQAMRLPDDSTDTTGAVTVTSPPTLFQTDTGVPGSLVRAACENGGGFDVVQTAARFGHEFITADGCGIGPWTIDGQVVRERVPGGDPTEAFALSFDDVMVHDGEQRLILSSGQYRTEYTHPTRPSIWQDAAYRVQAGSGTIAVDDLQVEDVGIFGTAYDRSLSARFTVTAPWTDGTALSVGTPGAFGGLTTSESGRDFTVGTLVLETVDGERLTLDIDGGRSNEALITLEREGAVVTFHRSWPLTGR